MEKTRDEIIEQLIDIETAVTRQEASAEFLNLLYDLAFAEEGDSIVRAKNVIYAMYARLQNARIDIKNAANEIRILLYPDKKSWLEHALSEKIED